MMVLLICVPRTGAQVGLKKVAQSTMNFLQVNVSARAAGLGESFIAVGEGAESLFFNPAGIAEVSGKFDVQMYNTRWITDIDFLAGALVWNAGNIGAFGFSMLWVDYGTINGTSLISSSEQAMYPRGYKDNGPINSVGACVFGLSYGRAISDRFLIGGNVRYAGQNLGESLVAGAQTVQNRATKLVFDAGVKYYTGLKSFRFGMAIRNFSSNLKREEISEPLPLLFTMGMAFDLLDFLNPDHEQSSGLLVAIDFQHPNNYTERLNFGLEYTIWNLLSLRGGYQTKQDIASWSTGIGLRAKVGQKTVSFDYAYSNFEIFQYVNRFSIGVGF